MAARQIVKRVERFSDFSDPKFRSLSDFHLAQASRRIKAVQVLPEVDRDAVEGPDDFVQAVPVEIAPIQYGYSICLVPRENLTVEVYEDVLHI